MAIIRINELPEGSGSLSGEDLFVFMDDPSGNKISKKVSLQQIADNIESSISNTYIKSDPSDIPGADIITNIVQISQANYDNIVSPDPNTIYVIND